MSSRRVVRRGLLTLACSVGLLMAGCGDSGDSGGDAAPPEPAYDEAAATAAADWLTGKLDGGLLSYESDFGPYTDYGLSIDAAISLDELDDEAAVQQTSEAVAANIDTYISGKAFGDPGSTYAGPAAKALVLAQLAGDPTAFGGVDLVQTVESVTTQGGPAAGRIVDVSTFGDNANVLGQAFAVQGLEEAGSARAADALAYLLTQQCSEGYFRLSFTKDVEAADQSCDAGSAKESQPDVDTTAVAVLAVGESDDEPGVADAVARATEWLAGQQSDEGAFTGSGDTAVENANSTGLAGWALGENGRRDAAESAATWVRSVQAGSDGACDQWGAAAGAIAYDPAALEAGAKDGITKKSAGQWLRSTAQAVAVLQWAPAGGESSACPSRG